MQNASVYLETALKAAQWIQSLEIQGPQGKVWPVSIQRKEAEANLYSGYPGVILFWLKMALATGDETYLSDAVAGADSLIAAIPEQRAEENAGLYTGLAGIIFTLQEVYRATHLERFQSAAHDALEKLHSWIDRGLNWDPVDDIVSGNSGIGLLLLYAVQVMGHAPSLELARSAGTHLLSVAETHPEGLAWRHVPGYARYMPNFSHGTAGVAYFLARLYQACGDEQYLQAALQGANAVRQLTSAEGLICHHIPQGEDLFYLGWCHGPAGTGRLYYSLWQITAEERWQAALIHCADGVLQTGFPKTPVNGMWNNVSVCCGAAGVSDFFVDLYRIFKNPVYLDYAHAVGAEIIASAAPAAPGIQWIHAENRSQPENVEAQTGLMQGAAGLGLSLLNLERLTTAPETWALRLPDNPF